MVIFALVAVVGVAHNAFEVSTTDTVALLVRVEELNVAPAPAP
jgi:hypothetical protein